MSESPLNNIADCFIIKHSQPLSHLTPSLTIASGGSYRALECIRTSGSVPTPCPLENQGWVQRAVPQAQTTLILLDSGRSVQTGSLVLGVQDFHSET